jgi:hypothetical protein
MASNTAHSRKSHRIAASWAGVAAALLATGALATTVVAGGNDSGEQPAPTTPAVDITDAYVACMRSAGGSPDTLEHWVDACQAAAQAAEDRYLACMHDVGGSPDSLERWVDACRQQAVASERP